VVETGSVNLQVPAAKVHTTFNTVVNAAKGDGGYVAESQSQLAGSTPSATVTLRVPTADFAGLVASVASDGTVLSEESTGQDVTGQYVDLVARINALEVSRSTYLEIETKATTIGDILAVQQQIDSIQQELEQLQGQQQVLDDQTTYGTVSVSIAAAGVKVHPPGPESGLARSVHRGVRAFVHGVEDIISALGPLLLVALVGAALMFGGRLGWRLWRRTTL
jgi:Domain of unknown function (DUF4349)